MNRTIKTICIVSALLLMLTFTVIAAQQNLDELLSPGIQPGGDELLELYGDHSYESEAYNAEITDPEPIIYDTAVNELVSSADNKKSIRVEFDEFISHVEPLGYYDMVDRMAKAFFTGEPENAVLIQLDWIISIKDQIPEHIFTCFYNDAVLGLERLEMPDFDFRQELFDSYADDPGFIDIAIVVDEDGIAHFVPIFEGIEFNEDLVLDHIRERKVQLGLIDCDALVSCINHDNEMCEHHKLISEDNEAMRVCQHTWPQTWKPSAHACWQDCTKNCGFRRFYEWNGVQGHHTSRFANLNATNHNVICTQCGQIRFQENHSSYWTSWSHNSLEHWRFCSRCNRRDQGFHEFENPTHICNVCGFRRP